MANRDMGCRISAADFRLSISLFLFDMQCLVLGVGFNEACVSTTFGSVLAIKARIWSIVLSLSAPSSVEVEKSLLAVESLVFEKVMGI